MKIKKFTGATMPEVMKSVKNELGEDAIILSSRAVQTGGFLGLFRKKQVEVTAGADKKPAAVPSAPSPEMKKQFDQEQSLQQDVREMKKMIQRMHAGTPGTAVEEAAEELGLSPALFEEMTFSDDGKTAKEELKRAVLTKLSELPFGDRSGGKRFVALFGPTGVGKTTTIAKLAARAVLQDKKKIGFITTDTYRVAAIEQLKTYANLLQAPVEVVYGPEEFGQAVGKLGDKDLIFIDTAGRNFREDRYVQELQKLIDFERDLQSYLVLSATAKEADMETVIRSFRALSIEQLIITKLDETGSIGPVVNCMIRNGLGLAYTTGGQEVPEDIERVSAQKLSEELFEGERHG